MAQFEFVVWLVHWLLQQEDFEFEWDQGNSAKSAKKHGIDLEYAEQVFRNRDFLIPLGIQISPHHGDSAGSARDSGHLTRRLTDEDIILCNTHQAKKFVDLMGKQWGCSTPHSYLISTIHQSIMQGCKVQ